LCSTWPDDASLAGAVAPTHISRSFPCVAPDLFL
jgi:hypothetical protein